ncbi:MAG TPA: hypothetical protein VHC20_00245 [Candidatus Paceibacterota bacterium]|nr:hypothetical protein [Candidatus Paceibacterota bacterium]
MSHDMINLLPPDRSRAFRRNYFIRLATVAFMLLTALVVIHGILLLPSYLYATAEVRAEQAALVNTSANADATAESAASELATLKASAAHLAELKNTPSASGAVRVVLGVPHPGVSLASITYTPPTGGNAQSAKMVLSGTAATREELRSYNLALTGAPFVTSVDLPISAYAEDTDIAFSMTITGTLAPMP